MAALCHEARVISLQDSPPQELHTMSVKCRHLDAVVMELPA
ncbi:MAG TPA: hypothetical protein VIX87_09695 [Steroidobacteraceae bacterium]